MKTKSQHLLLSAALLGALSFAGCSAPSAVDQVTQSISLPAVPDVPGCDHAQLSGQLTTRAVAGVSDLYVVYSDGKPLCADSREDLERLPVHLGIVESNPMPGLVGDSSSNPMPGQPGDPAASNPMPGEPAASNPMPGRGGSCATDQSSAH